MMSTEAGCGLSGDFVYTADNHRQTVEDTPDDVLDEPEIEHADIVGTSTGGYRSVLVGRVRAERR